VSAPHSEPGRRRRILVVAYRTAATPRLIEAVRRRAESGGVTFTLLVPRPYWDPDTDEASATLELAVPLLEQAAGSHVPARIGDADPFVAVRDAVAGGDFDEVMISTLPARVSHWLRRDLPARVERLGLPVEVVTAEQRHQPVVPG
jgi:hypothetical protein